jgi:hypothetical protein
MDAPKSGAERWQIVTAAVSSVAIKNDSGGILSPSPKTITIASIAPTLVMRGEAPPADGSTPRTKIGEFNTNLHCSIIGTCLSTGELRQLLKKLGLAPREARTKNCTASPSVWPAATTRLRSC